MSFVGLQISHCGLYWNEISDKLAKQGAMKNMSEISPNNLLLSSHEINSLLKKTVYKQFEKSKFAIPSCSRYLARVSKRRKRRRGEEVDEEKEQT